MMQILLLLDTDCTDFEVIFEVENQNGGMMILSRTTERLRGTARTTAYNEMHFSVRGLLDKELDVEASSDGALRKCGLFQVKRVGLRSISVRIVHDFDTRSQRRIFRSLEGVADVAYPDGENMQTCSVS